MIRSALQLYRPEFPQGWYLLGRVDAIRPGQIVPIELCGDKLVAFRTRTGRVVVSGRYCPHMGAAFTHGRVVGERIRCPFHAWEFDVEGRCVAAPDVTKIPPAAQLDCLPVVQDGGFVWAHAGGRPSVPFLPVPELEERAYAIRYRYADLEIHPLMVLENAADPLHIRYIHKTSFDDFSTELLTESDALLSYRITLSKRGWLGSSLGSRVDVMVQHPGPGYLLAEMSSGGRQVAKIVAAPTPLADGRVRVHHISAVRRIGPLGPANTAYAWLIARVLFRGVTDDYEPIWRDMRREGPRLLVKHDALQQKVRAFYQRKPVVSDGNAASSHGRHEAGAVATDARFHSAPAP